MIETKFYIDLTPHPVEGETSSFDIFKDIAFKYLKPYPKAEVSLIEGHPSNTNDSYLEWCEWAEFNKQVYNKFSKDIEKLKSVFNDPLYEIETSFNVGATNIIYEGELYTESESYEMAASFETNERFLNLCETNLSKGHLTESFEYFKKTQRNITDSTSKRDSLIAPRIVKYCEENKINSLYAKFGYSHIKLAKLLPNSESRKLQLWPHNIIPNSNVSDDIYLQNFMQLTIMGTLSGNVPDKMTRSFYLVKLLHSNLWDCVQNVEREVKKGQLTVSNSIKKILRTKLKEIAHKERFNPYLHIPKEWGGMEYTTLESHELL